MIAEGTVHSNSVCSNCGAPRQASKDFCPVCRSNPSFSPSEDQIRQAREAIQATWSRREEWSRRIQQCKEDGIVRASDPAGQMQNRQKSED